MLREVNGLDPSLPARAKLLQLIDLELLETFTATLPHVDDKQDITECRKLSFLSLRNILSSVASGAKLSSDARENVIHAAKRLKLPDVAAYVAARGASDSGELDQVIEFQLQVTPEHLLRSEGDSVDSRVSFKPDNWQRELLNAVDHNDSVIISAPTSSGKTFISYYVMENVLRRDDVGLMIFLAPSKALVNQANLDSCTNDRIYFI